MQAAFAINIVVRKSDSVALKAMYQADNKTAAVWAVAIHNIERRKAKHIVGRVRRLETTHTVSLAAIGQTEQWQEKLSIDMYNHAIQHHSGKGFGCSHTCSPEQQAQPLGTRQVQEGIQAVR